MVFHYYKIDDKRHITRLFIANPRVFEIFCNHHDILPTR